MVKAPADIDYVSLIEGMPPGALLTLQDVGWDEYEALLRHFDERPALRFTYDQGRLQIMTTSPEHENIARSFGPLIMVLAEESGTDYVSFGTWTMRKRKKSRGLEADDCFYVRSLKKVAGKPTLDFAVDPPPDLAVEVDVASG